MEDKQVEVVNKKRSLMPQTLTGEQLLAIEYLAAGYSQTHTAKIMGIPQSTISHWCTNELFIKRFKEQFNSFIASQEAIALQTVALAQVRVQQAITGEIHAGSEQVRLAVGILDRTIYRDRTKTFQQSRAESPEPATTTGLLSAPSSTAEDVGSEEEV